MNRAHNDTVGYPPDADDAVVFVKPAVESMFVSTTRGCRLPRRTMHCADQLRARVARNYYCLLSNGRT